MHGRMGVEAQPVSGARIMRQMYSLPLGVKRIAGILEGVMSDIGKETDLALLHDFADYVPNSSICGFGWNATHPLKTAMRYFADHFAIHLKGDCPTRTCVPLRWHRFAPKGVL